MNSEAVVAAVYAYSMLAPGANGGSIIFGRIVQDGTGLSCPQLTGSDGSVINTQVRPLLSGYPGAAANFPVTVCEGLLAPNTAYSNAAMGIQLAAVSLSAAKVQVYGDSGCNDKSSCPAGNPSAPAYPSPQFKTLAALGAASPADLILHMGDFNYRGTSGHLAEVNGQKVWAYDAGDGTPDDPACEYNATYYSQNSRNSPRPDLWVNWQADFFEPAQALLPNAPWVFARGNHELCSRAGLGWFYFLGPGSSLSGSGLQQMQCPDQGDFNHPPATAAQHIEMIPPYLLSLDRIQLWVMDSANACDGYSGNALTSQYTAQYNALAQQAVSKPVWIVSHRPLWGYQSAADPSLTQMLQAGLTASSLGALPASVSLSLAGHMHIFESISFLSDSQRPPQIIIGNSGVSLSSSPGDGDFSAAVDGQQASGNADQAYGYMSMTVQSDGSWNARIVGTANQSLLDCSSSNVPAGSRVCRFQ